MRGVSRGSTTTAATQEVHVPHQPPIRVTRVSSSLVFVLEETRRAISTFHMFVWGVAGKCNNLARTRSPLLCSPDPSSHSRELIYWRRQTRWVPSIPVFLLQTQIHPLLQIQDDISIPLLIQKKHSHYLLPCNNLWIDVSSGSQSSVHAEDGMSILASGYVLLSLLLMTIILLTLLLIKSKLEIHSMLVK